MDVAGLHAAYGIGLLITVVALAAAWWSMPQPPTGRSAVVDVPGAALLGAGLLSLLLAISQTRIWVNNSALAGALLAAATLLICLWVYRENRCATPLVNLALLRHPAVAGVNIVMLLGGIGMYLLLSLVTRYVQTPQSTGCGFGVGVFSAAMPAAILAVTPPEETSSAMSFNQVIRRRAVVDCLPREAGIAGAARVNQVNPDALGHSGSRTATGNYRPFRHRLGTNRSVLPGTKRAAEVEASGV